MMTMTQSERRSRNLSSESLITLEMMADAKAVQAQGRADQLRVTIVSCELASESVTFPSELAYLVRAEGL